MRRLLPVNLLNSFKKHFVPTAHNRTPAAGQKQAAWAFPDADRPARPRLTAAGAGSRLAGDGMDRRGSSIERTITMDAPVERDGMSAEVARELERIAGTRQGVIR